MHIGFLGINSLEERTGRSTYEFGAQAGHVGMIRP
jgi:hypothetical protein